MRHRSRHFAGLSLAAASLVLLGGAAAPMPTTSLSVSVVDLRSSRGVVRACLTDVAKNFSKCAQGGHTQKAVVPAGPDVTIDFENVVPGRYAIALFHDENNNDRMDRAMLLMPKEGFGFSKDAKVVMGPPKFADAAFDIGSEPAHQTIRMRYMF